MSAPTPTHRRLRIVLAGLAATAAAAFLTATPTEARFFVGVGLPFGYYGPGPYYYGYPGGYPGPYYHPYYYPPAYYAPPPAYYPPPPAPAVSAYAPPAAPSQAAPVAAPSNASAAITYTSKPAFHNSAGQTCREYKTGSSGRDVFGTACQQTDGQWRVVN